jgi:SAM-dependent methyltransferase
MTTDEQARQDVRSLVREKYGAAAGSVTAGGSTCCPPVDIEPGLGAVLYADSDRGALPAGAVAASLGCGNPTAVADLHPGERVLDLGSGGGIDVLLSARRVGPSGFVYGLDMTEEMLDLARGNAAQAGVPNVEFLHGHIEDVPLPDGAVDVVISNCVVNLSPDKPAVLAEAFRVLAQGGRLGISDIVADDALTPAERAERGSWVGCIAGAVGIAEFDALLRAAGFVDVQVTPTHEVAPGMHAAIIRGHKPDDGGVDVATSGDGTPATRTQLVVTTAAVEEGCCGGACCS